MANITKRTSSQGVISYRALVRIYRNRKVVVSKSKTFPRKKAAEEWAKKMEIYLSDDANLDAELVKKSLSQKSSSRESTGPYTLGDALRASLEFLQEGERVLGRTKRDTLIRLQSYEIAKLPVTQLKSMHVLEFAKTRKAEGAGPSTIDQDLIFMALTMRGVRSMVGLNVDDKEIELAKKMLRQAGMVGRSRRRDRRPRLDELEKVLNRAISAYQRSLRQMTYHDRVNGGPFKKTPKGVPMHLIAVFAIASTRRLSEITGMRWSDISWEEKSITFPDGLKNPKGRMKTTELNKADKVYMPEEAIAILKMWWDFCDNPDKGEVFPFEAKTISANWLRLCGYVGIEDLKFHDLRHEGISWLFERHWNVPQVAMVSGHKSWDMLARYTHLSSHDEINKYEGWKWFDPSYLNDVLAAAATKVRG